MIEIRTPTPDDLDAMFRRDEDAFGDTFTPEQRGINRPLLDLERFRLACAGSTIVGMAGSFAFEVTLPGGVAVPMAGTTWVSVAATHRRQGLLRRLMDAIHADIDPGGATRRTACERSGDLRAFRVRPCDVLAARGDRSSSRRTRPSGSDRYRVVFGWSIRSRRSIG